MFHAASKIDNHLKFRVPSLVQFNFFLNIVLTDVCTLTGFLESFYTYGVK